MQSTVIKAWENHQGRINGQKKKRQVLKYKVFKGNGFSFRYPLNWEIGVSQAKTTKAFVRAITARTGYSANCNVNIGTVKGIEDLSQKTINNLNWKIHDLKYLSRIKSLIPDAKITNYNTETYLSNQPASSFEYIATIKGYQISTTQKFFQIMTIRKPKRYVVTCRCATSDYPKLTDARN